jgi:hypothetical protein
VILRHVISLDTRGRQARGEAEAVRRRTLIRDAETALEFAVDAYVYLYPLVLLDLTRRVATGVPGPDESVGRAPANAFAHVASPLPPTFRDVVRPSFDTLHSFAWLDVTKEPVVVSVPDAGDRYYVLSMIDMWSDLVAAPGTRTAGNWPAEYAVVPRGWDGDLPEQLRPIEAPTAYIWIVGRIERGCGGDEFQSALRIALLSRWGGQRHRRLSLHQGRNRPDPLVDPSVSPVDQVDEMSASEFFVRGVELLRRNLPHVHDHAVLQRIERIGIVPGEPLDLRALPRAVTRALSEALVRGRQELDFRARWLGRIHNGWQVCNGTMGTWGTDYLKRAAVARHFLGAGMCEDVVQSSAFVDDSTRALDGAHAYRLVFASHDEPPAHVLWSLTAYDENGYVVPNAIDRYALGSRDPLERGPDGSLELAIQHSPPRHGPASNWLPCPAGRFNLCLRLYRPERDALDDTWSPPPMRRSDERAARPRPPQTAARRPAAVSSPVLS